MVKTVAAFVGPSLPPADRVDVPGISYLPPAARGDVERASRDVDAILLIDGVFHHDLAPSPKEVFAACRRARVYGAASMGALRAVECKPYGAVPIGAIAGWYDAGCIDGDDEVAVAMRPDTFAALTVASVNVRYVARLAVRRAVLTTDQAADWVHAARTTIYYAERSWPNAIDCAPPEARPELLAIARAHGDLKRWDARFALRHVIRSIARVEV